MAKTTANEVSGDLVVLALQVTDHEKVLRGKNGNIGLIARVKTLEDALMESKWYLRGIVLLIIGEIVARLAGLL